MSVAVWVGLIALAGLDAETGVVMLLYLDHAWEAHHARGKMKTTADLHDAVKEGAVQRIRPKIMRMKQGWAFAWRSLMAAEIYVTILSGFGLGHLLHYGRELNSMEQVIGVMFIIVAIGLLADKILFSPWERFLLARWGTDRRA